MALYAFDGTGNDDEEDATKDSNVVNFFSAYIDPNKNDDPDKEFGSLYLKGIGTLARTLVGMGVSEAFGIGGHSRIEQAMARFKNNRKRGDTIVDVVGFSRGAALAMSFANRIDAELPGQEVRFVGVFDVVGQFGLPGRHLQAGHLLTLPKNVKVCRHAMAMDESRALFPLTRLCDKNGNPADSLQELWFRGVHSDVGGGNGNRCMNWIALNWMFQQARKAGLPLDPKAIELNLRDRAMPQQISDHELDLERKRMYFKNDCMHFTVNLTPGLPGRPHNNPTFTLRRVNDEGAFVEVAQA